MGQKFGGPNVTHQARRGGLNVTVTFSPPSIWGWTKSFLTHHYRVQKVTWTKRFWDPVSLGLNVRVELSLGPKVGGLNIKVPVDSMEGGYIHILALIRYFVTVSNDR